MLPDAHANRHASGCTRLADKMANIESPHRDTGRYPCSTCWLAVTLWSANSPDALHVALGEGIADRVDGIENEHAVAIVINAAEHIVVQAANGTHSKSGKWIRAGIHIGHVG